MNLVVVKTVILIIAHYELLCNGSKTECIVDNENNQTEHCLSTPGSTTKCHSLNDLPSLLNSSETEVVFCSANFTLHFHLAIQGVHNVSLVGNPSTFTCIKDAGLTILDSTSISIRNITFEHCGVLHNSTTVDITNGSSLVLFRSALYIFNSTDITLESVTVKQTNGLGLTFFDTDGNIEIKNCTFVNNSINLNETKVIPGGGGVYIEFTFCLPGQYGEECDRHSNIIGSTYQFDGCKFIGNNATSINRKRTDFSISEGSNFYGLGRGGGLNVVFRGAAANNSVILNGCQFVENSGVWGGGLKVTFRDRVSSNSFTAHECVFESNKCINHAGGGADIGYSYYSPPYPHDNKMKFRKANFTSNVAKIGGGIAFYSSGGSPENLSNIIEFDSCKWTHNKARFGSAVDISTHAWTTFVSGYLPSPKFRDSVFLENYVIHKRYDYEMFSLYKKGNAAFLSTEFTINFFGTVNFTNNNGSALFLVSSVAIFEPYTDVTFHNNSGFNGGAIALIGFSVLILNDNMHFLLSNNTAVRCGGAIYSHSIDKHDYISSRSCFIHNSKVYKNEKWKNSSVTFINNMAGPVGTNTLYCGHSISATTLLPCYYACKKSTASHKVTVEEAFTCYANFTFLNSSRPYELITSGANFTFAKSNETIKLVPSKEEPLPVGLIDDLEQNVNAEIFLDITMEGEQKAQLDRSYAFLSDNKTVIYGEPGSEAFLTISKTTVRENAITLKFKVEECPPGYINKDNHCVCSVGSKHFYSPVYACNHTEFVAISRHGYWIGYVNDDATEDNLLYSDCPSRRCFNDLRKDRTHYLTKRASKDELNMLVCGNFTTGILCSTCRKGYSTIYHSGTYTCSNKSCKFGWLYYIVSELLPITVFFVVVIIFNISFVTGDLNGFIFFAHMQDSISFTAQGFIWIPRQPKQALKIARIFYRFFNLDFFRLNELSFCLWNGANLLDMLAFKYVTVAYASLLVVGMVWLMNKCNLYQRIYCLRASTMRVSITHGLSAFLIMLYTQYATISLKILDFSYLYSKGHKYNRTVVTYQGDIEYFHTQHLPYAIPALICVMTMVILPAVILLCYPSCFKIVSFFHLGENKCVSWFLQKIPHAFLKPFVDSFQSCFKDNLRFFAGLYFVYRLMLLSSWIIPSLLTQQFMLLELLFVFMLLVHSVFQPYKKRWHNVLDALFFFILSVINGITVYNYHYSKLGFADKIGVDVLLHIQIFLAYLPLVYFVIFTIYSLVNKIKNIRKLKTSSLTIQLQKLMKRSESDDELPSRLEDNKDVQESDEDADKYHIYHDNASIRDTY